MQRAVTRLQLPGPARRTVRCHVRRSFSHRPIWRASRDQPSQAHNDLKNPERIVTHPGPTTKKAAFSELSLRNYVLTISCGDMPGIVHAVTGLVGQFEANIIDSAQFGDPSTNKFFMRVHFSTDLDGIDLEVMRERFSVEIAPRFDMKWELHDADVKPRVMLMVSKIGHCLNDLLYRWSTGQLPIEIPLIVSNHKDFYQLAASYNIPFHHLPITRSNKEAQEERIWELHQSENIDFTVLARYMQILSPKMCQRMSGKAINIHHSFLPSFKGAKPYFQAFDRGVKLVGSTAHYVTSDLDEGPIIEQGIERVDHTYDVKSLTTVGSTTECVTLARAVKWHAERRVLMNETKAGPTKTVIFK